VIVTCEDLRKTFSGGVEAVRGVSFEVREGEAFGLLGPNGAGKTTTIRMLGTLLRPTSGRAIVAGHDVSAAPDAVRRSIGVALQDAGLARYSTGREHVDMMARLFGMSRRAARERAAELLELFDLTEAADRLVRSYSGGMRRRLDLACGLVHQPRLLILDEPTTGVDPTSRAALWEELRRLQRAGTSLLLTTHYLEEADRLCDRLAIVDRGVIVVEGTPERLKSEVGADLVSVVVPGEQVEAACEALRPLGTVRPPEGAAVALETEDGARSVVEVVEVLAAAGIRAGAITVTQPTLDDVFFRHTGATIGGREGEGEGER
jgi:ABC-2 type transport system ATP-binding protein